MIVEKIRIASFNVVSIITGTGFGTSDFNSWGGVATTLLPSRGDVFEGHGGI